MTNTDSPLDDLKKNAQVRKFMTKYRYQYHQTMLNDLVTLMDSYCHKQVIEARKTEIEFLYDIADDELKAKLREAYKYRGVNFGLSFTPAPENDTGRKALNHRKER